MMVALWVWAVVLWMEGLEPLNKAYLLSAGVLIAASALTKYFGVALIPLLLAYSLIRLRRLGWWAAFLLIPIVALIGCEVWTAALYGKDLIAEAMKFSRHQHRYQQGSAVASALESLSFAGGCTISALLLIPVL